MPLANISWSELNDILSTGQFQSLFVGKLGWDYPDVAEQIPVTLAPHAKSADASGTKLLFVRVVEKKSVSFLTCDVGDVMITKDQRRRAERELTKHVHEHIVIYHTSNFIHQIWQIPRREPGKPIRLREMEYRKGSAANELHQFVRRLHFSLRDEANLTVVDVMDRIDTGVQAEKVTKKFYEEFNTQRKKFVGLITGITDENDRSWYAAIMLNRLMFSWFLQSKGMLNSDPNYLRNKLNDARNGKLPVPNFQSFYDTFLKALFHDALNQPTQHRDPALKKMLGNIPYINGGIFDRHKLENDNPGIEIPDSAFDSLFDLFGRYTWHLDDRPIAEPNEINPDVLGHIFEKFVNQKEKGAYYTKEDVTGYMSQNTIIPWLLDQAKKKVSIAFDHTKPGSVWELLKDSPETYIYDSMKHGVIDQAGDVLPMPDALKAGENDYSQRDNWNQRAEEPYALPTETWREYFHRRKRTIELLDMLRRGDIHEIDDLITWNLSIRQFMQDIVAKDADVSLVKALWNGVREITILDPTVGSGAFLFAAVRVLEPIADELLIRMEALVEAEPSTHPGSNITQFKRILEDKDTHPNQRYYIMRQIILHNLYGVDIEEEAVEICKLRLFLLLVATLDDPKNIEPLPDLDFNIRAGNTLVGYATRNEVDLAVKGGDANQMRLDLANNAQIIDERAEDAATLFEKFKSIQSTAYADVADLREAKQQYESKISELRSELDGYLHQQQDTGGILENWREQTKPFHWFAEFHRVIIGNSGFDVVLGNPPYVRSGATRKLYALEGLMTGKCPDIYAMVMERSKNILNYASRFSMIVPLSMTFSKDFRDLREFVLSKFEMSWTSSYARIPAALFSADTRVRNSIIIARCSSETPRAYTTRLHRWYEEARPDLFQLLQYSSFNWGDFNWRIPRYNDDSLTNALADLNTDWENHLTKRSKHPLIYRTSAYNWLSFTPEQPPTFDMNGQPAKSSGYAEIYARDDQSRYELFLAINGRLGFLQWSSFGDDLNVTKSIIEDIPFPTHLSSTEKTRLCQLGNTAFESLPNITNFKANAGKMIGRFDMYKLKNIFDESDLIFFNALGWDDELWEQIELQIVQINKTERLQD